MFCFVSTCLAQKDSLYVQGNQLKNKCNESVILRGVNYSVLDDWSFPANLKTGGERLSEIVKSGANAVRIQWYENYNQTGRPAYTVADLDSLLTRCARYQMIPVIGLWDLTCSNDWPLFNQHVNWWLQPSVVALLKKHRSYAILNITNEFGEYEWTDDTTTALYVFTTNYNKAVKKIRQAGISVPIMIDAPDCGQNGRITVEMWKPANQE